MSIVKLPLCYKCGVPHVPENIAERVRSGEDITIEIISHKGIASNVLKWGTGGLNIDASRVGVAENDPNKRDATGNCKDVQYDPRQNVYGVGLYNTKRPATLTQGRFPSHLLLSHSVWCVPRGVKRVRSDGHWTHKREIGNGTIYHGGGREEVDFGSIHEEEVEDWECVKDCPIHQINLQSGIRKNGGPNYPSDKVYHSQSMSGPMKVANTTHFAGDSGGASRYFQTFHYFSKASRAERNAGCEGLPEQHVERVSGVGGPKVIRCPEHDTSFKSGDIHYTCGCPFVYEGGSYTRINSVQNTHPTVKSLSLMRWLCRLITPPDGIILDPFLGSGSTAVAAIHEGFHFIGIEQDAEYVAIAEARIAHAKAVCI